MRFNIRNTLIIRNTFTANVSHKGRTGGKSEREEIGMYITKVCICILLVLPQSPEKFVQDAELGERNKRDISAQD